MHVFVTGATGFIGSRVVSELIGAGQSTRQIAAGLHIDVSTVETYRARIKEKLNLEDSLALLQFAIRWHIARSSGGE